MIKGFPGNSLTQSCSDRKIDVDCHFTLSMFNSAGNFHLATLYRKVTTPQPRERPEAISEVQQVLERIRRIGTHPYNWIYQRTYGLTKARLLNEAKEITRLNNVRRPDRLCHRHRDALLCWYVDNISYWINNLEFQGIHPIAGQMNNNPLQEPPIPQSWDEELAVDENYDLSYPWNDEFLN
jgi:hypothetical protein